MKRKEMDIKITKNNKSNQRKQNNRAVQGKGKGVMEAIEEENEGESEEGELHFGGAFGCYSPIHSREVNMNEVSL